MNIKFKELAVMMIVLSSFIFADCADETQVCLSLDGNNFNYESTADIAGFQFDHDGCVTGASGGDATANGFTISASGTVVLAFSFTGAVVPAGSGTLLVLEGTPTEGCLSAFVFSDASGGALVVNFSEVVGGCMDSAACNYNADAEEDDGSCEYVEDCAGECGGDAVVDDCDVCDGGNADMDCAGDCNGNAMEDCAGECNGSAMEDVCGECDGTETDPSACAQEGYSLSIGEVTDTTLEIIMNNEGPVAGFQMSISGVNVTGAAGGSAEDNGFTVSSSATTVLGFSFTGSTIPPSNGVLTILSFDSMDSEVCIVDIVLSDPAGGGLDAEIGDCYCGLAVDCANECGGGAVVDECGECGGDGPDENFDCDGNCIVDIDCSGICGGSAQLDDCGVCDGGNADMDCAGVCDGDAVEDECGICEGDGSMCTVSMSISLDDATGNMLVHMSNAMDVAGFQFVVSNIIINSASGGSAEENGFTISASPTSGVVLGFSFTGSVIPPDNGVLVELDYTPTWDEACISDVVLSDVAGEALNVEIGDCIALDFVIVDGCMDDMACSYNPDANNDDGSCIYESDCFGECGGDALEDCAGECGGDAELDQCGECGGDGSTCEYGCLDGTEVCLTIEGQNLNYESTEDIAGFQFNHNGCVTAAYGGDAEANGLTISSSDAAVLAFSFTGSVVPAGNGTLVVLEGDISEDCLYSFVFSDAAGEALVVNFPVMLIDGCTDSDACNYDSDANNNDSSCVYAEENYDCDGDCIINEDCNGECGGTSEEDECGICEGDGSMCTVSMSLSLDDATGNILVHMSNAMDVAGFQFNISNIDITSVSGGSAEENGFLVSGANSNVVGFSLTGDVIPPGEGVLIEIEYTSLWDEACLNSVVIADPAGNAIDWTVGDCIALDFVIVDGCMDSDACNYNPDANQENGSCYYAEENFDCDGNCLIDVDCAGECGGDAQLDICGECEGGGVDISECMVLYNVTINPTGESHLIIFEETITGLSYGDEIGVFDLNGVVTTVDADETPEYGEVLVGSSIWLDTQSEISTIMSIDLSDFGGPILNGAIDGNDIGIKVYSVDNEVEYQTVIANITTGGEFGDMFTVISDLELSDPVDVILGCTNESSCNYNPDATHDDGSCESNDCEIYIELELTTTVDESELEDMEVFEENFESLIETELDLPAGSVQVTDVTISEIRDIEVTVDFTITLTEEELAETEFTSEDDINDAWEDVEDEIDDGLPEFVYGCTDDEALNYDPDANVGDSSCYYDGDVTFYDDVFPIINTNCTYTCHQGGGYEGGLSMMSYEDLMAGGDSGPAVVPYDSDNSLIIQKLNGTAPGAQMPYYSDPLDEDLIDLIAAWIDTGALETGDDDSGDTGGDDGGDDGAGTGTISDCDGNEWDEEAVYSFQGDGYCNDGSDGGPNLNCVSFYYDLNEETMIADCPLGNLDFGEVDANAPSIDILLDCQYDVDQFEFNISGVSGLSVSGGTSEELDFDIVVDGNTVQGTSTGNSIPSNENIITVISFDEVTSDEICLNNSWIITAGLGIQYEAVTGNCINADQFSTTISYAFGMHYGANLVSFHALPDDTSLENIMASLGDGVTGVIGEGVAASPNPVLGWVGSLDEIERTSGYWIKMNEGISLSLEDAIPTDPSIVYDMHYGANLISFPISGSVGLGDGIPDDVEGFFTGVIGEGVAASPNPVLGWVGSLSEFEGTKGYWAKTDDSFSFSYDLTNSSDRGSSQNTTVSPYEFVQSSKQAFYFIEGVNFDIKLGDWIVAYSDNIIVGSRQWNGLYTDIPAMGYDGSLYSAGYCEEGNSPRFVWIDGGGDAHNLTANIPGWSNNEIYNISLEYLEEPVPSEYSLVQNYPNPFNPSTTISFTVPSEGHVTISIFNINGRLVSTLLDESINSGYHSVVWDGIDANGLGVSAGLYVYTLQAEGLTLSSKMVLMK
jgi:hypothetical protein